jgi:phenylacetate-CoA ligase
MKINRIPNPIFLIRVAKSYLSDVDRIFHFDQTKLKKFQDKAFRNMVKYASSILLYNKKFYKNKIHPSDVKGLNDIKKLPFISKNDIRKNFPNGLIPKGDKINRYWKLDTSGTTGKPISIFRDLAGLVKDEIIGLRCFKYYDFNWKIDRLTRMGSFSNFGDYDYAIYKGIYGNLQRIFPVKNIQNIGYFFNDAKKKIRQISKFNPTYLFGLPGDIKIIADYKKNGLTNISPKCIVTSGSNLSNLTRKYIEDIFDTQVFDIYTSVEMGTGAFQCEYGNYHVNSDFIYFEYIDDDGNPISLNEPGHITMTRLFGKGTPLIRYSGLDDIVTPMYGKCPCGLETMIIKHIEGRRASHLISQDGTYINPFAFIKILDRIINRLKFYKILQYQIIQEKIDKIIIYLVIDEIDSNIQFEIRTVIEEIKLEFQKILGPEVEIIIRQTDVIKSKPGKPPPEVISKVVI